MSQNPFEFMDFSLDEALEADIEMRSRPAERDARVCLCGHPMARHTQISGLVICKPTRMGCPCKKARAVLESDDVRPFLRKTGGAGVQHALGRGLAAAVDKGIKVKWIVDMKCDRCQKEGQVSPVPVTQRGFATFEATGYDALLCSVCRQEV